MPLVFRRTSNSPKWSASLNGDYTFQPIGDFTPYVGASWHYVGVRGWGFNGPSATFPAGLPEANLPDYNTLDLRVGVDWNKWTLELYGKNLNDAKGISGFSGSGTSRVTQPFFTSSAHRGNQDNLACSCATSTGALQSALSFATLFTSALLVAAAS